MGSAKRCKVAAARCRSPVGDPRPGRNGERPRAKKGVAPRPPPQPGDGLARRALLLAPERFNRGLAPGRFNRGQKARRQPSKEGVAPWPPGQSLSRTIGRDCRSPVGDPRPDRNGERPRAKKGVAPRPPPQPGDGLDRPADGLERWAARSAAKQQRHVAAGPERWALPPAPERFHRGLAPGKINRGQKARRPPCTARRGGNVPLRLCGASRRSWLQALAWLLG